MNENSKTAKIIYNVTTQINAESSEAWLQWTRQIHIPAMMQTGCFEKCQLGKLLIESGDVVSYAIQYYAVNIELCNKFDELYSIEMEQEIIKNWGAESLSFATLMEIIK